MRSELIALAQSKKLNGDLTYWARKLPEDNIVVSDIRFKEDINFYAAHESILRIRLECDRKERLKRGVLSNENHISETDLDDYNNWDYVMDTTNRDLIKIKEILKKWQLLKSQLSA